MRRFETLLALLAVILASLAALQLPGRVLFALVAIGLIVLVGMLRLRAALGARRAAKPRYDAGERARAIREERDQRFRH